MGYYLNPKQGQLPWLREHAEEVSLEIAKATFKSKGLEVVLCRVDNGPFCALAVAYSPGELDAFTLPDDYRLKSFWLADREDVIRECPDAGRVI